jgi:hypothetical protein
MVRIKGALAVIARLQQINRAFSAEIDDLLRKYPRSAYSWVDFDPIS